MHAWLYVHGEYLCVQCGFVSVCARTCVWMCLYVHVCGVSVCAYVCTSVGMWMCVHQCLHMCMCARMCACTCVCVYMHVGAYVCMHVHVWVCACTTINLAHKIWGTTVEIASTE